MRRRQLLAVIGIGATTGLAGCGGQDDDTPTATATSEDGGGVVDGTETPTNSPTPANATGGTPTDGSVSVADIDLQTADNYRMRIELSNFQGMEGTATYEGRWHSGNFRTTVTAQGGTSELAHVDGTNYLIGGGECIPMDGGQSQYDTSQWEESASTAERLEQWADVTATGTDTMDGEEVYVFEVEPEGRSISESFTYYISAATGYTRRVETEGFVAEYWDWGEVEPVEAPC